MSRRKAIPLSVKLEVALAKLGLKASEIEWDHIPALALREWDPVAGDTIPPANSPDHIQILTKAAHREKTHGPQVENKKQMRSSGDRYALAKLRMVRNDTPTPSKPKRPWPRRPLRSRNTFGKDKS